MVVAAASVLLLPTITQVRSDGGVDGFVAADSPTVRTEIRSFQEFAFPLFSRTVIVQHDPQGLPALVQAESVLRCSCQPGRLSGRASGQGRPAGAEHAGPVPRLPRVRHDVLTYLLSTPSAGFREQYEAAQALAARSTGPEDAVVGVTGSIPARVEQGRTVENSLPLIEIGTVAAIVLIVALVFRSLVAPLLTVLIGGIALVVTVHAAPLAAGALGVKVPSELEPLYVALVLGVVTDYVIFFLSALRRQVADTADRLLAARRATAEVAPVVAVAGLTVTAGTAVLAVARSDLFRAFGPGMALAVLVGMLVSVTLTPALLATVGRVALWPTAPGSERRPRPPEAGRSAADPASGGSALFTLLSRRVPAASVLGACVLVLTLAALPLRSMDLGLGFVASLPEDNPVAAAAQSARRGFADGILSPTLLLVEHPDVTGQREALARFGQLLREQPGVAGVVGPGLLPAQLDAQGIVLSRTGNAARYLLVLDDPPLGAEAIDTVAALRERAPGLAGQAGLPSVRLGLGGDTALAEEVVLATTDDLLRISLAALAANLLMLVVFLRALVAPVLLLAASVLALAASLGLTTLVFQTLLGEDGLTFYVPFAAAVLLVALGSDYNIFGVGSGVGRGPAPTAAGGHPRGHASVDQSDHRPGSRCRSASGCWRSCRCAPSASSRSL